MPANPSALTQRKFEPKEIKELVDANIKREMTESDRVVLQAASRRYGTSLTLGPWLGLGLGILLSSPVRRAGRQMFTSFRSAGKPSRAMFAGGREDIISARKPFTLGSVAGLLFLGAGGWVLGGAIGIQTGNTLADRIINKDPDAGARIEKAMQGLKADLLRK